MLRGPEYKRLKVAAPSLFHPIASPLFEKGHIFHITTQSPGGGSSTLGKVFGQILREDYAKDKFGC